MFGCCYSDKSKKIKELNKQKSSINKIRDQRRDFTKKCKQINTIFLGSINCGKTSVINSIKGNFFSISTTPTEVLNRSQIYCEVDGKVNCVNITDISGSNRFVPIIVPLLNQNHIATIIFEKGNLESINQIKYYLKLIQNQQTDIKIVLVQNKSDILIDNETQLEQDNQLFIIQQLFKINFDIVKVSAMTHENMDQILQQIIEKKIGKFEQMIQINDIDEYILSKSNISSQNSDSSYQSYSNDNYSCFNIMNSSDYRKSVQKYQIPAFN